MRVRNLVLLPSRGAWWLLNKMGRWAQMVGEMEMRQWKGPEE